MQNCNVKDFLFPHVWQKDPMKTNLNYQDTMERNKKREIDVFKCSTVCTT